MSLSPVAALIIWPIGLAAVALLVQRWPLIATASGLVGLWLLRIQLLSIADTTPVEWLVLGRSFTLDSDAVTGLQLLLTGLLFLFLLTLLIPQLSLFVPVSLLLVSPLSAMLLTGPTVYTILAYVAVVCIVAILIQSNAGSTQGALRLLIMMTIAAPFFLIASWMIEMDQGLFARAIGRLLLVGVIILLAGFPFHLWLLPIVEEAPPFVLPLLFGLIHLCVIIMLMRLIQIALPTSEQPFVAQVLRLSGGITVGLAALIAFQSRRLPRLIGVVILLDIGSVLMAMASWLTGAIPFSYLPALLLLRFVSLTLIGFGIGLWHAKSTATSGVSLVLLSYGTMSLIGVPLTPGFIGRWTIFSEMAAVEPGYALLLVVGMLSTLIGFTYTLQYLMANRPDTSQYVSNATDKSAGALNLIKANLPIISKGSASILLIAAIIIALKPDILLASVWTLQGWLR